MAFSFQLLLQRRQRARWRRSNFRIRCQQRFECVLKPAASTCLPHPDWDGRSTEPVALAPAMEIEQFSGCDQRRDGSSKIASTDFLRGERFDSLSAYTPNSLPSHNGRFCWRSARHRHRQVECEWPDPHEDLTIGYFGSNVRDGTPDLNPLTSFRDRLQIPFVGIYGAA